jgi:hypothetical protein
MNRINCSFCNFIAFSTDKFCKRCKQELKENTTTQLTNSIKFGIPTFEINSCGVNLIDYVRLKDGTFETMKWIVLIGVPIIPLSAWKIQPHYLDNKIPGTYQKYTFEVIDQIPLKLDRILKVIGINLISIIPIILMFYLFDYFNIIFGLEWGGIICVSLLILSIFWLIGVHWRFTDNGVNEYTLKENI